LYIVELGYKQLLQVHDELIVEGPEEHAEEVAMSFVLLGDLVSHTFVVVGVGASCRVDDEADRSRAANRIASRRTIRQDVGRREINQHSDSFETLLCLFFYFRSKCVSFELFFND
jgi:hypothetical protein